MTQFEFVFILYALLLGLSLIELLGGFGRALELKFASDAGGKAFKIGALTPLFGLFVMLDLLSFWVFAWAIRDTIEVSPLMLLGVMLFASAYYLAARLVFPTDPTLFADLDTHFYRVRRVVFTILITLVAAQWLFLLNTPELVSWTDSSVNVAMTLLLAALMVAGMVFSRQWINAVILVALIVRYLLAYWA